MKILIITNLFPNNLEPARGTYNKQQITELSKLCELKVIAPLPWHSHSKVKEREIIAGIEVFHTRYFMTPKLFRSLYGFLFFFSLLKKVKKIYRDFKFDLIYSPWAYPDGYGSFLIAKKLRVPIIIGILGSDINIFTQYFLRRKMISCALKRSDGVIAVSTPLKERAVSIGVPSEKISVIKNGVDTNLFKPMARERCRQKLGLGLDKKIILFIGNLVPVKGINYLIDAFSGISGKHENIELVIVGEGYVKKRLLRQVNKLSLSDKVRFIPNKPHNEIPLLINACDVFCLPSLNEGCPNVLLEALACGKPVVATNVGGISEIISSQDYGILVPPKNSTELSVALENALNKNWNFETMVEGVFNCSWSLNAKKVFELIEDVVNKRSRINEKN